MDDKQHFMIIDFQGNPGLHDPRSDYRLSLLTRVNVFSDMKFAIQKDDLQGDSRLCIEFKCRAGLDMPGRMQRFVDQLLHHAAQVRPCNPIRQILFSSAFPHL